MMRTIGVNGLGAIGIIKDIPAHELPLNAWSDGQNVRMFDGKVEKFLGHSQVFDPPSIAPYYLQTLWAAGVNYWIYPGLEKVYVWNGTAHTNITRQTAAVDVNYGATADKNWTGGILGGIPILNNGIDDPQQWSPVDITQKLVALSNWPANTKCEAMRVFKQFLVALNITKTTTNYPHLVKWSHPADPGTVPSSWDETDPTLDAGEYNLSETDGALVDALKMRDDLMCLYKEDSVWGMQYIGGVNIFRFFDMFKTLGMLSKRCAVNIPKGRQVVFALDDVIVHNGQTDESILEAKTKKWLFRNIDSSNYRRSFIAHNASFREVWVCFPETGQSFPNKALVWNYAQNTMQLRDIPLAAYIEGGSVDPESDADQWQDAMGSWDSDSEAWGERLFNPTKRRLVMAVPGATKLYYTDVSNTENGTLMTSYVERTGIGIPFKQDSPPDLVSEKFFGRIWPRIEGLSGSTVKIQVGTQDAIGAPVQYQLPQDFVIGSNEFLSVLQRGRLLALKFLSDTDTHWSLSGYQIEVRPAGRMGG